MSNPIQELHDKLNIFYKERDWLQFHTPKNLVMALTGEVGELSEIFQWLTPEQSQSIMIDDVKAQAVKDELADIFIYTISLADKLGVDIVEAANNKVEHNAQKYPVSKSRGNAKKYSEL